MIDPHITGAYIARLRKERDWTQLELADKLHVTHQAVSRWETGDSFPDLGTLAQLAQVFQVHIENLLDGIQNAPSAETGRSQILAELAEGHAERVAELVKAEPADLRTVVDIGALTRPSMMDRIVNQMSGYSFSLEQVKQLAPFVSQELLDTLIAGLDEKMNAQALSELAPFLSRPVLARQIGQLDTGSLDFNSLVGFAPFLDRESLDRLTGQIATENIEGHQVVSLAPFLGQGSLEKLIERVPEGALGIEQVASLAPFVHRSRLASLLNRVGPEQVKPNHLVELAPFLDRQALSDLIQRYPTGEIDAPKIVELAPFVDRQTLERLIRNLGSGGSIQRM